MVELFSGDHIIHRLMSPANQEVSDSRPTEKAEDLSKPELSIKKKDGSVIIEFKKNEADSIKLFGKRGSEESFTLLAEISGLTHTDTRPNIFNAPELREYKAHYVKDNKQTGLPSDVTLIIKK
jgi:hypothetical protein